MLRPVGGRRESGHKEEERKERAWREGRARAQRRAVRKREWAADPGGQKA